MNKIFIILLIAVFDFFLLVTPSKSENNKIRELIKNETETRSSTKVAPNDANVRNSKT